MRARETGLVSAIVAMERKFCWKKERKWGSQVGAAADSETVELKLKLLLPVTTGETELKSQNLYSIGLLCANVCVSSSQSGSVERFRVGENRGRGEAVGVAADIVDLVVAEPDSPEDVEGAGEGDGDRRTGRARGTPVLL